MFLTTQQKVDKSQTLKKQKQQQKQLHCYDDLVVHKYDTRYKGSLPTLVFEWTVFNDHL